MWVVALVGIAALSFLVGLYPGIHHRRTFSKQSKSQNPPDAVQGLGEAISAARRSVDVLCGELNPLVFDPLTPLISHHLRLNPALRLRLVATRTISGLNAEEGRSETPVNQLHSLAASGAFGDQLQIRVAKEPVEPHFAVADARHLCVEQPHPAHALMRHVIIYRNSGFTAVEHQARFDRLWEEPDLTPAAQVPVTLHSLEATDPGEVRRIVTKGKAARILQEAASG